MQLIKAQKKLILLAEKLYDLARTKTLLNDFIIQTEGTGEDKYYIRTHVSDRYHVEQLKFSIVTIERAWRTKRPLDHMVFSGLSPDIKLWFSHCDWSACEHPIEDLHENLSVIEFGKKLGFSESQCRFIIDRQMAFDLPTFSSIATRSDQATKFTKEYGGYYYLYRFDWNEATKAAGYPHGVLNRSALTIRYPVGYSALHGTATPFYRVRVRMNVPALKPKGDQLFFKYDGYVVKSSTDKDRNGWWNWLLQQRNSLTHIQEDIIHMHTRGLSYLKRMEPTPGILLTQAQGDGMEPMVSKVCLVRVYDTTATPVTVLDGKLDDEGIHNVTNNKYYVHEPNYEDEIMSSGDNGARILAPNHIDELSELDKKALDVLYNHNLEMNLKGLFV